MKPCFLLDFVRFQNFFFVVFVKMSDVEELTFNL